MMPRVIESLSPPPVWGGYLVATLGGVVSLTTIDTALGLLIKVLTVVTISLAILLQTKSFRKR